MFRYVVNLFMDRNRNDCFATMTSTVLSSDVFSLIFIDAWMGIHFGAMLLHPTLLWEKSVLFNWLIILLYTVIPATYVTLSFKGYFKLVLTLVLISGNCFSGVDLFNGYVSTNIFAIASYI